MAASLTWPDFWGLFKALPDDRKRYVAEQLAGVDFDRWMHARSPQVIRETLDNAPIEVALLYISLLPQAQAKKVLLAYPKTEHARLNAAYMRPPKLLTGGTP